MSIRPGACGTTPGPRFLERMCPYMDSAEARKVDRVSGEDYASAERFLNGDQLVFNAEVNPRWLADGTRFWYRNRTRVGMEFILVDPEAGVRLPAFDHVRLAASLSLASDGHYIHNQLPFDEFHFTDDDRALTFEIDEQGWTCDLETYACTRINKEEFAQGAVSPDGSLIVSVKDGNVHVRDRSGSILALTTDGQPGCEYATAIPSPLVPAGIAPASEDPPAVMWSPDGKKILTHRIDRRDAGQFHLVQSVPLDGRTRPALHSYTYPLPGDQEVPFAELVILDADGQKEVRVDADPLPVLYYGSPLRPEWTWWSKDSSRIYIIHRNRGYQGYSLVKIDVDTGEPCILLEEQAETAIDPHLTSMGSPNVRVLSDAEEIIWFSQRDGWGHLYLYDGLTGEIKNQITSGPWAVADIVHVDESGRDVYFTAVGREEDRDPYYCHLYRVGLDGGDQELLTPEDASHEIAFSPSGQYFVDTYSRVDLPPTSVLRARGGRRICTLEEADIDLLLEAGWTLPERFCVKARDGVTDICGIILRPADFHPSERLPVLDDIYGGPQTNRARTSFAHAAEGRTASFWQAQALAELGFIVVMIDGLGMPYRWKAYHDVSFRNLGDGGIEDHITALRQLAGRYPYMDLDRVGIYGHSAGGYASAHAILSFPHFYKVAVSSAGNHDHRLDKASWVERYMGLPVGDHYDEQANASLAGNLEGKLLLIHGEMDENVHVASTLQLVDALIRANKDFDMLILPNRSHACTDEPYFVRKRWDYFVRHLLGVEPPKGYQVGESTHDR